jgi:membrane protease YdiL (CAAX protease family)
VEQPSAIRRTLRKWFTWLQLAVAYGLVECALWSSTTADRNRWALITAVAVVALLCVDRLPIRHLGLGLPSLQGTGIVLMAGAAICAVLVIAARGLGAQLDATTVLPVLSRSGGYLVFALLQEFLLQSFFFTRCEQIVGDSAAAWMAATLFAAAHLPNFILSTFSLAGALFFCEMFRRYRNVYVLGIVHAGLGLTVALCIPDRLLHHMRAGIGYLIH